MVIPNNMGFDMLIGKLKTLQSFDLGGFETPDFSMSPPNKRTTATLEALHATAITSTAQGDPLQQPTERRDSHFGLQRVTDASFAG